MDAKVKKEIEDIINDEYNNVSNLNVKDDGEVYFTLPVKHGRFGYDVDDIYNFASKNKAIKIEVQDAHVEQDDPDDSYKKLLSVTCKVTIDDELMDEKEIYSMRHIELFENFEDETNISNPKEAKLGDLIEDTIRNKWDDNQFEKAWDDLNKNPEVKKALDAEAKKDPDASVSDLLIDYLKKELFPPSAFVQTYFAKEIKDAGLSESVAEGYEEMPEMASIIYNTLMKKDNKTQLDLHDVRAPYLDGSYIYFTWKGLQYQIKVAAEKV